MISHTYDFKRADLFRLVGLPLIPVAVFALIMHLAAYTGRLPAPRPTTDVDRTILVHKVEACRQPQAAEILLLGDSSCLTDVAARQLSQRLGRPVLNLGTVSYLDLNAYASLLRAYAASNPGRPRSVVLLLHPEALRRAAPEPYHVRLLQSLLAGQDCAPAAGVRGYLAETLALEIFRGRLLARAVPTPLPGSYGRRYGFSDDLEAFLAQNYGTLVDPDPQPFQGNAEYRLAPTLELASRGFRAAVPPGVKLLVGITPVPEGFVKPTYRQTHEQMLARWSEWVGADAPLKSLPPTLPGHLFAKTTHLNAEGARFYTELVAQALAPSLK